MKQLILRLCCVAIVCVPQVCLHGQPTAIQASKTGAPKATSQPVAETFFGRTITDPYRNLENVSDPHVMNWYKAQAAYTNEQLSMLPLRDVIYNELKDIDSKFTYKIALSPQRFPTYRGNKIFYIKSFADDQVGKFYYSENDNSDVLVFDPNKGNNTDIPNKISGYSVADDGAKVCIIITRGGNEIGQLLVVDTKSKKIMDRIEKVWSPPVWQNNDIFFYTQASSSDVHSRGMLSNWVSKRHVVGQDALNDSVVISYKTRSDIIPDSAKFPTVYSPHKNAKYLVCHVASSAPFNNVYLSTFPSKNGLKWYPFIKEEDQVKGYIIQGNRAFGLSVRDNKNGRILLTSAANPNWSTAKIIAEAEHGSISGLNPFAVTKNYVYYIESYGVEQKLYRVNPDGSNRTEIKLPVTGTIVPSAESPVESDLKIFVTSYTLPMILYDFDESKQQIIQPGLWLTSKIEGLDNVEVEETYATSYDGTKIPLTIIKPKGIKKDGTHKVIISGYGNYGIVDRPAFDPDLSLMGKYDIIKAIAHVRGGGVFGEPWRLGGFKATKPNTWKDAIACAEYLIKEGYTQPSKMGIMGMSAGGILVGRAITDRPDLFAVAIAEVGVLNTLRFEFTPNGPNHINEFGTITNEEDFKNLYEMDSYIQIKDGVKYPATLITGGMNDPRVIVWQPAKFAARLQGASTSGKPVLFRMDIQGGHGNTGGGKDQRFKFKADLLAFFLSQTANQ